MKHFFYFFILFTSLIFPQKWVFQRSIGSFNDAVAFTISSRDYIYVIDDGTNEIYKLDSTGAIINEAGGTGFNDNSLNNPADVYAGLINIYVCDKDNNSIKLFDADLNFISLLYTKENSDNRTRFAYPVSCTVSRQGDLFILDSENNRVVKFDIFGNFSSSFGGNESGNFKLSNPSKLRSDNLNRIYVFDNQKLYSFDQFGTPIKIFDTGKDFVSFNIFNNLMLANDDKNIYITNLNENNLVFKPINIEDSITSKIVSSYLDNGHLYLLTGKEILIFDEVE